MTNAPKPSLDEILQEAREFQAAFGSLLLATADAQGVPHASYAPYVTDDAGCYFVYVSELATHTANLQATPRAGVLFIEDEDEAQQLFARRRLTCDCCVQAVGRGTPLWEHTLDRLEARHGKLMAMLRGLQDFHLFRLVPLKAGYVRGFAQAYELSGEQLSEIRHINDKGHRPKDAASASALDQVAEAKGGAAREYSEVPPTDDDDAHLSSVATRLPATSPRRSPP